MRDMRELRLHVMATTLRNSISRAKARLAASYFECRDDDANAAHDDLVATELKLRMVERSIAK